MSKKFFKAFSLIEVAIAITILGLVIAGIVPAINSALRRSQLTGRKAVAHRLAQERIEQLRLTNLTNAFYDNLFYANGTPINNTTFQLLNSSSLPGNETYGNLSLNATNPDDPFAHYRRISEGSWDVDQDGNLTNETANKFHGNLSLVRVSVDWNFNNDTVADYEPVQVTTLVAAEMAATALNYWAKTYSSQDFLRSLQQTSDGYILGGYTSSYGAGSNDYFLVKTDSSGNFTWSKAYGGSSDEQLKIVQQISDGYILGGYTSSYGAGSVDYFLVKTDASGNLTWAKTYGGSNIETGESLQQTSDGGYILAGDTRSFGAGNADYFLVKTDASGNLTWAKTYGGSNNDGLYRAQQTSDGGYILAGSTRSFGAGNADYFLVKTDASGNLTWAKTYGGSNLETILGLQQTSDGYILGGYTSSYGAGNYDYFLVKTDASGNLTWAKTYGGSNSDYMDMDSLQQISDGYILGGNTYSFGAGSVDYFLVKTDASGNLTWAKTYGSSDDDFLHNIQQTSDNGYILGGESLGFGAAGYKYLLIKTDSSGNSCLGADVTPTVNTVTPTVNTVTPTVNTVTPTVNTVTPTVSDVTPTVTDVCP